jgi:murein DD-endopeptidase MepM/ murein hydrolase activator NlpD
MPRKNLLVIVPPAGGTLRSVRIRSAGVIILGLLIAAGVAGYCIPRSGVQANRAGHYERKNLERQNQRLEKLAPEAFKLAGTLRREIKNLEKKIDQLNTMSGLIPAPEAERKAAPARKAPVSYNKIIEVCARNHAAVAQAYAALTAVPGILDQIPVNYPIADNHAVSARFGPMNDPFTNSVKNHYGVDYAAPIETPVNVTAAGVVTSVENHRLWGKKIVVAHGYGFSTVYAHLGSVLVSSGRRVKKGETIATVGVSGVTTGPHLHYEIWRSGKAQNPEEFIFPDPTLFFAGIAGRASRENDG